MSDPRPSIPRSAPNGDDDDDGGRLVTWLLLALALVPYLLVLGDPPLWDANEPLYAEPPREVLEHGDFFAPTFDGERWFAHPPLSTWVTVPFYAAFGVSPASERLPMALAAMATILLTFSIARSVFGRRAASLAALVLAATPRFWLTSRQLSGDVYLTTLLVGAFALALPSLRAAGSAPRRLLAAYALVGIAMLAKGPVVLVLFGVPLGIAARFGTPRAPLRGLKPFTGLAVALAVGLPWFGYMTWRFGSGFLEEHFLRHNLHRFLSDELGSRPFWYYLPALLGDGQPWIMIVPLAAARAIRARDRRPEALLPWAVAGFIFLFFSLSTGKRNVYLLPAYPMLSIVLAPVLLECWDGARRVLARWAGACLAVGAGGAGVLLLVAARNVPGLSGPEMPMTVICFAAALAAAYGAARASGRAVVAGIAGGALALEIASAFLLPTLTEYRPVPRIAATLVAEARPGDATLVYAPRIPSLMFYAARHTILVEGSESQLVPLVPQGKRAFVVCWEEAVPRVRALPGLLVRELERRPCLEFQFRRLVLGEGKPTKDLVLLVAERSVPGAEGPTPPAR